MITIWLVLWLAVKGQEPMKMADVKQADLETCMASARHALDYALTVQGEFEFQAICSVVKSGEPA